MKFLLATTNVGKLREMGEMLSELSIDTISMRDAGTDVEIEETGATFFENALIKAKTLCNITGMPAIADDSGLVVKALGGAPGVYSKRYGGGALDDKGLYTYLLDQMKNTEQRDAKFVCSIVCVFPNGSIISANGECPGAITTTPRGEGGFGYDPVFGVAGTDKTMAELSSDEKNAVSHRGAAMRELVRLLKEKLT